MNKMLAALSGLLIVISLFFTSKVDGETMSGFPIQIIIFRSGSLWTINVFNLVFDFFLLYFMFFVVTKVIGFIKQRI